MSVTLRQLQRMLSKSLKTTDRIAFSDENDGREFVRLLDKIKGVEFSEPVFENGEVRERCGCANCRPRAFRDAVSFVDKLTKKFGHNATISQLLQPRNKTAEKPPPEQPPPAPSGAFESRPPAENSLEAAEPPQPENWQPTPAPPEKPRTKTDREKFAEGEQRLREEMAKLREKLAAQKATGTLRAAETELALRKLRRQLKDARKQASKINGVSGIEGGPSLQARRRAAGTHGRLRVVPPQLRTKTAELINRLVHESGAAGDRLTPIPVLSARKVVKRMLVRRPLGNAFKEDSNSGRPVTLFLPDVSPSCARVAQASCDVANAAGYAGVSGSDVLVFPHSNGEVEPEYVPWFNGRPNLMGTAKTTAAFEELIAGRSRYNIRVVVAIGDHDAEEVYRQIVALPKVVRLVWLHNHKPGGRLPVIAQPQEVALPSRTWTDALRSKTTMVFGCSDQTTILRGLELALS